LVQQFSKEISLVIGQTQWLHNLQLLLLEELSWKPLLLVNKLLKFCSQQRMSIKSVNLQILIHQALKEQRTGWNLFSLTILIWNWHSISKQVTILMISNLNWVMRVYLDKQFEVWTTLLSVNLKEVIAYHLSLNFAQSKILLLHSSQQAFTQEIHLVSYKVLLLIQSMRCWVDMSLILKNLSLNFLLLSIKETTQRKKSHLFMILLLI